MPDLTNDPGRRDPPDDLGALEQRLVDLRALRELRNNPEIRGVDNMPDLTKTRTVFFRSDTDRDGKDDRFIDFKTEAEDCYDSSVDRWFPLPLDVWDDMGRPHEITVTIEPGDLLNAPLGGEPGSIERAFNESEGDRSE